MFDLGAYDVFKARIQKTLPYFDEDTGAVIRAPLGIESVLNCARTCSPYLARLMERWPDIAKDLAANAPEIIYQDLMRGLQSAPYEALKETLRHAKQRIHLLAALCDLAGVWDWNTVTAILSDFADKSMGLLIKSVSQDMGFEVTERGPVPGLFVLALGKYGGRELNYSSDIDLIVFYDPEHIKLPSDKNPERALVRFVKKLMRGFDDMTSDGYIFRTDLRLRPDPRANSVAVSTLTAERYYETLGQNWERAAMIKARFCGGDEAAANDFIAHVLTPFIWRRSLDYAAISDIHSIKRQIQGGADISSICAAGHDLKLGLGGIREIEFYTQVQQLILGGRNTALRTPRTVDALQALQNGAYAKPDIVQYLQENYARLRDLEHRTQMFEDEQTHIWPQDKPARLKLMAMSGGHNLEIFEAALVADLGQVHTHYSELFPNEEDLSATKGSLVFTGVAAETVTLQTLQAYEFVRPNEVWALMASWLGGRIRATRTPRARELLTRLAPRIIEACGATGAPDDAFFNFTQFIEGLNAGVTLFSLFLNKPETLLSVIDMLVIAPRLAANLSAQPGLLDAMIQPDFLTQHSDGKKLQYNDLISHADDFETALDNIRRVVHDDHFSLTASLLKLQNIDMAGPMFSGIASAAVCALLPKAVQEVERVHGVLNGSYAVIGMGKFGSEEMGLKSDLDMMLVYEAGDDDANAQGKFNKLTRRLITALSSVTSAGGLYEVDMALRPSGRSGPLAVPLQAFQSYYKTRAWTWEYMALCRARCIASSTPCFGAVVTNAIQEALLEKDFDGALAVDVLDMHARLARDKPPQGVWDVKGSVGGLRDIEFIAQYVLLKHKPSPHPLGLIDALSLAQEQGWLSPDDANALLKAGAFYHRISQMLAISIDGVFDASQASASVKQLITKSGGYEKFPDVQAHYETCKRDVTRIFSRVIV